MTILIVQLTDTHLFAEPGPIMFGGDTHASFEQVLTCLQRWIQRHDHPPDLLLLTGDLSQDDSPASYRHLHRAIAPLARPTYWLPGNHDQNTAAITEELSQAPFHPTKAFQAGGWQLILLDTMLPKRVQGRLSEDSLAALESQLRGAPDTPTLIALHHPPFSIDSDWMDAIALENAAEFWQICDRHPQIRIVLCGHIHQEFSAMRGPIQCLGTPSTCVQFLPKVKDFAVDPAPPGFRWLQLNEDGSFNTGVERVCLPLGTA